MTGAKAFEGTSLASLIAAILDADPPPPSTLQPITPPALDRVVRKCLAKDPEDRWQMRAVVVHDEVHFAVGWEFRIHLIEKFQKLLVAMPTMTLLGSLSRWRR